MRYAVRVESVSQPKHGALLMAASVLLLGALVHLAIPVGGPAWYAFFGAPPQLVAMAEAGSIRPALTCIVIAAMLVVVSAYGFSGAGTIRRLPGLRIVLALVGAALTVRGLGFIPIALWRPQLLGALCGNCDGASAFLVVTSVLCLAAGIAYLSGALRVRAMDGF